MSHPYPGSYDENGRPVVPPPTAPPVPDYAAGPGYGAAHGYPDEQSYPGYPPPQPAYAPPPGQGQQAGYGQPASYGAPGGYGQPGGYQDQPYPHSDSSGQVPAYVDPAVEATYRPTPYGAWNGSAPADGGWTAGPRLTAGPNRRVLAVAALAIGGLALVLFWIFPAGITLGLIGVVVGVVALLGITRGGRGSKGFALSGTLLSAVAMAASTALLIGTGSATLIDAMRDDPTPTADPTPSASDGGTGTPGPGTPTDYTVADWALPITAKGDLLGTIEGDGFTVDVYQVATATADRDLGDPGEQGYIAEGDAVVMFNYVATNTSGGPINVSISRVNMQAKYEEDESLLDTGYYIDFDEYEKNGIDSFGLTSDAFDDDFEVWEPGTSYAEGDGTDYRAGKEMTFTARLTPLDDKGEFDFDRETTGKLTVTIK